MMMDWSGWGYGMIFGPLFMIFVLVVAIAAAIVSFVGSAGRGRGHNRRTNAAGTPADRYSQGAVRARRNRQGRVRRAPPGTRRLTSKRPHHEVGE